MKINNKEFKDWTEELQALLDDVAYIENEFIDYKETFAALECVDKESKSRSAIGIKEFSYIKLLDDNYAFIIKNSRGIHKPYLYKENKGGYKFYVRQGNRKERNMINNEVLFFFEKKPGALPLYELFVQKILSEIDGVQIKVQKTQISFSNKHNFAFVSFLPVRKAAAFSVGKR